MKKNRLILSIFATALLNLSMISCVSTKTPVTISDRYEEVSETINKSNYEVKFEYPVFAAPEFEKLNAEIEGIYKDTFKDFKSMIEYDDGLNHQFWYELTYEIYTYNDLKSVLLQCSTYSGGAHGNTQLFSYCYDPNDQKFLTAAEASGIPLQQLALRIRMKLSEQKELQDYITDDWFMEGTAPFEENYNTFTMDKNGITVYFEPYRIAPYAAGIISATIK